MIYVLLAAMFAFSPGTALGAEPDRFGCSQAVPPPTPVADWTVMIFINGDNDLESAALQDLEEIADVGSTDKVNVIVQLDLLSTPGTARFRAVKGMKVFPTNPEAALGEVDMGAGRAVECFVDWALRAYPARKTALVVWDHGQGWREGLAAESPGKSVTPATRRGSATEAPYKSISRDWTDDNDELYNRELADALRAVLGPRSKTLDVLAFDACLMAMVETAYAFRDVAAFMVGSEDIVPPNGFDYRDILQVLTASPEKFDARGMAELLVASYERFYEAWATKHRLSREQTLSAIDLGKAKEVADAVSAVADQFIAKSPALAKTIETARLRVREFAPDEGPFHHVDAIGVLSGIDGGGDNALKASLSTAQAALARAVVKNYAGRDRASFPAKGIAIYFPTDADSYASDPYARGGYEKANKVFPVEFVEDFHWGEFLHRYWKDLPTASVFGPRDAQVNHSKAAKVAADTSRRALVIGNAAYPGERPLSAREDAASVARALREVGFLVTFRTDRGNKALKADFDRFLGSAKETDTLLVYFAGHGLQLPSGENVLLPVDSKPGTAKDRAALGYGLTTLFGDPGFRRAKMRLVIVDACRTNRWSGVGKPFSPGLGEPRGAPGETLVAFAAEPGGKASDGAFGDYDGVMHSPYTMALLRFLRRPGMNAEETFKNVRELVWQITEEEQRPWEATSLTREFQFRKGAKIDAQLNACDDVVLLRQEGTGKEVMACGLNESAKINLSLPPGDSAFTVSVFNQKTCRGGNCWSPFVKVGEGWKFELVLTFPNDPVSHVIKDGCGRVKKNGAYHGMLFPVASFVIHVDEGDPSLSNPEKGGFLASLKGEVRRLWKPEDGIACKE